MLNPYLFYNGNCEAAFKYYEKVLGGKIEMLLHADEGPADMKPSPGNEKLVMHARMSIKGQILMASDAPPERFNKPQGFATSLTIPEIMADATKEIEHQDAVDLTYTWSNFRMLVKATSNGIYFGAELERKDGACTVNYKVTGIFPATCKANSACPVA